ncbi:MAG: response regulator [Euryarchaeota archaeon]|nr:response regulator [Euryarchaeota archaeon]
MKIMVVDDEPDIVVIVGEMLRKAGYGVIEARNGRECLEKLKKEKPDLILLDVMMPDILGWDVCKKIKEDEMTKSIPVAMLTVKSTDEDKERSFKYAHCDAHINKPIIREKLLSTVEWLLKNIPKKSLR